jgi:sporulation protein YlmC with PRC-barrel domain
MLEDLHIGVPVRDPSGGHLGTLTRIVVARDDRRVTHLVVDPGLLESGNLLAPGGWEKPRERVVPVSFVTSAIDKQVALSCEEAEFRALPLFEQEHAIPTEAANLAAGEQRPFEVGQVINYLASDAGIGGAAYLPPESITFNEPAGASEIAEGTPVWRREPHHEIGSVDRVLLDPRTQRISALVVKRKGLFGHSVVLPIAQVADIDDGVVHITLSDHELDALARYQPDR